MKRKPEREVSQAQIANEEYNSITNELRDLLEQRGIDINEYENLDDAVEQMVSDIEEDIERLQTSDSPLHEQLDVVNSLMLQRHKQLNRGQVGRNSIREDLFEGHQRIDDQLARSWAEETQTCWDGRLNCSTDRAIEQMREDGSYINYLDDFYTDLTSDLGAEYQAEADRYGYESNDVETRNFCRGQIIRNNRYRNTATFCNIAFLKGIYDGSGVHPPCVEGIEGECRSQ